MEGIIGRNYLHKIHSGVYKYITSQKEFDELPDKMEGYQILIDFGSFNDMARIDRKITGAEIIICDHKYAIVINSEVYTTEFSVVRAENSVVIGGDESYIQASKNAYIIALGSKCKVYAENNSTIELYNDSRCTTTSGTAKIFAWENSRVVAKHCDATINAYNNAHVYIKDVHQDVYVYNHAYASIDGYVSSIHAYNNSKVNLFTDEQITIHSHNGITIKRCTPTSKYISVEYSDIIRYC